MPFKWSPGVAFMARFMTAFAGVIAVTKDLPDIAGDLATGVPTLATKFGVGRVAAGGRLRVVGELQQLPKASSVLSSGYRWSAATLYWRASCCGTTGAIGKRARKIRTRSGGPRLSTGTVEYPSVPTGI